MGGFPTGSLPDQLHPSDRLQTCRHCRQEFGIPRWDRLCGFIIRCPHCGTTNGKHWSSKAVLLSGLFFNIASFFLVLRPLAALRLFAAYVASYAAWNYFDDHNKLSQGVEFWSAVVLFLSPVLVNAGLLVRHEEALDEPPPHPMQPSTS